MRVRLYSIPGSHPAWTVRLMLERKGIAYSRVDLIVGIAKPILRLLGFPGTTVPALKIDGRRLQGSRAIGAELDRLVPEPPLYPADAAERAAVEATERWGDEVLQPLARRIVWAALGRDRGPVRSYLTGSRLGIPLDIAAATAAPLVAFSRRYNHATDERVRADLAALPALVDRIDADIAAGTIGGAQPNAADLQVVTSIALLLTLDDLRPLLSGRPAGDLAGRLVPDFPGHAPPVLPAAWLEPVRAAAGSA